MRLGGIRTHKGDITKLFKFVSTTFLGMNYELCSIT